MTTRIKTREFYLDEEWEVVRERSFHLTPVISMCIVREPSGGRSLLTFSIDGMVCKWTPDDLTQLDSFQLGESGDAKKGLETRAVAHLSDYEIIIGGDTPTTQRERERLRPVGDIIPTSIYYGGVNRERSISLRRVEAHTLPITSISLPSAVGPDGRIPELCLSASMDSSLKLWSLQRKFLDDVPLLNTWKLERCFCIYELADVKWSPVHPALFASTSSRTSWVADSETRREKPLQTGLLNVWNLNSDVDAPVWTARLDGAMLTKLLWGKSGQQLLVGDDTGHVLVYSATDRGLYLPEDEEWARLERAITEMRDGPLFSAGLTLVKEEGEE